MPPSPGTLRTRSRGLRRTVHERSSRETSDGHTRRQPCGPQVTARRGRGITHVTRRRGNGHHGRFDGRALDPRACGAGGRGLLLVGLAILVTVSVFMRTVGAGFVGTVEFGAMAMVLLVALGAPAVAAADENFRLEIVDMFAPPRVVRALDKVALAFQLLVSALVTWFVLSLFLDDLRTGTTMAGELGIQRAWLTGVLTLGLALTAYAVAVRFVRALRAPSPEEG
ncbi:TRAP transporter small permease [Kocuria tytonicola]|uniref:TRAP transporter small permease n=1 Tax=Kocuria tytonicola TaxID=2055946 RepID=A0A3L9LBK4_9MICC|nr:TRAP transporter small permease [Kocuria tytonicola]RLY93822.1 TRAP transporter small permease [Kocuria tytonicola]